MERENPTPIPNQNPISVEEVRTWRKLAEAHQNNVASKIILRLLDERREWREELSTLRLKVSDKHGPLDGSSPCPFGKEYKGEPLGQVPDSWLRWWFDQQDRDTILNEMDFDPSWAKRKSAFKKLRLFDYLEQRFNGQAQIP
jgi:hypothetical protein